MKRISIICLGLISAMLNSCVKDMNCQTEKAFFNMESTETRVTPYESTNTPTCLYIGGSAMEWGWDLTDSRAVIQNVANGIYRGVFDFNFADNNGFKFWEATDYSIEYGMATESSFGNISFNYRTNISTAVPRSMNENPLSVTV